MAVTYLDVSGITQAAVTFQQTIGKFDQCVIDMEQSTKRVLQNWVGARRNQFESQMSLMTHQLHDISEGLYDIYDALVDSEAAYIEEDEAVAKQFSISREP